MPVIIDFIDDAAGWLASKGTDQWAKPWPNRPARDSRVERGIRHHCTWMVEDEGRPVATLSCRPAGNRTLWTESELAEPAVYASRLIVSRSHSGQDLGAELLDWAGLWAARQYGARWIRIDVWTTNTMLHNYYEKRGFEFVRRCESVDSPSAALFQKPTACIGATDVSRLTEMPMLMQPGSQPEDPDGSGSS